MKVIQCRDGNVQNIYECEAILLARVKLRYFKLSHGCKETEYKSGMYRQAYLGSREVAGHTFGRPCIYNGNDGSNTPDFSIELMGKSLKHKVVFLLANVLALTSFHILCHSGQTKYCNTEKGGGKGQAEKNSFEKLRGLRERCMD